MVTTYGINTPYADRVFEVAMCGASKDGECSASWCPQLRDEEPQTSGRHCPFDAACTCHSSDASCPVHKRPSPFVKWLVTVPNNPVEFAGRSVMIREGSRILGEASVVGYYPIIHLASSLGPDDHDSYRHAVYLLPGGRAELVDRWASWTDLGRSIDITDQLALDPFFAGWWACRLACPERYPAPSRESVLEPQWARSES